MIAFIDDHRDVHGVEPICEVLPIAPSTYRAHAAALCDPEKSSARAKRDAGLREKIRRVYDENFLVQGARKIWRECPRNCAWRYELDDGGTRDCAFRANPAFATRHGTSGFGLAELDRFAGG